MRAAARAGVGFYGKNTMLITRRHGSWVVLGTLVTDVEIEPSPPLELDCGDCRLCIDACPTGALDEPGDARRHPLPLVLDAGAGARSRRSTASRSATMVYGCDICQDVCPWNRGVEKRRSGEPAAAAGRPSRSPSGCRQATARAGCAATTASTSRGTTPRYLRRNALVALGNAGAAEDACLAEPYATGDDDLLREHAEWALARLAARGAGA